MSRILLVHQPTDGGVGRHVADLARGLTGAGHEVVLCGPSVPDGLVGGEHATALPDMRYVRLDLQRAVDPRADIAAVARFARILRSERPEIVHAHSSKAGAVVRLARALDPSIPVVYSPHGYSFAGHFERASERTAYRLAERVLGYATSRALCVCEAEARLARSVTTGSRVRVVYNGIACGGNEIASDAHGIAGDAHGIPANRGVEPDARIAALAARGPVLGALTLLRPGKGVETLIDALPAILERRGDVRLAIVGDGPGLGALQARARERGVEEATHFVGPTDEPLGALAAMTVFVHPSWAEAFPYVILEAMSLGLPIVATDVGGVGEALVNDDSGVLVAPRDDVALASAMGALLEDPQRMVRLGERAQRRARERFTLERMIAGVEEVYGELTRRSRPKNGMRQPDGSASRRNRESSSVARERR